MDLSNASGEPTPNTSNYRVVAANATWGVAVYEAIQTEFSGKARGSAWLHGPLTYDLLLFFLGFPTSVWGTWRIWEWTQSAIPPSGPGLSILVVLIVFLGALYVFRVLFGVARWLWPYIELQRERQGRPTKFYRSVLGAVSLGIVVAFLYDLVGAIVSGGIASH